MRFFLDTYALIEIARGNFIFEKYLEADCFTFKTNLAEMYYFILRQSEEHADYFLSLFLELALDIPVDIIPDAMHFRLSNRKKNISYVDALGYSFARKQGLRFLTGERAFSGKENADVVR